MASSLVGYEPSVIAVSQVDAYREWSGAGGHGLLH